MKKLLVEAATFVLYFVTAYSVFVNQAKLTAVRVSWLFPVVLSLVLAVGGMVLYHWAVGHIGETEK